MIPSSVMNASDAETSPGDQPGSINVSWTRPGSEVLIGVGVEVIGIEPSLDGDENILIPEVQRVAAEVAIEEYSDVLAVAYQCRRNIRSPEPCVIATTESPGEFDLSSAIATPSKTGPTRPRLLDPGLDPVIARLASDRLGGLSILANSLSEESPVGRARDIYRLYENAYGLGVGSLAKRIYSFLCGSPYPLQFSKKEVHAWLSKRGGIMHADRVGGPGPDIRSYLDRMEWAAFDLLLHKKNWMTSDNDRRPGMPLKSGPSVGGGTILFGSGLIQMEWLDPFRVYESDQRMTPMVPNGYITLAFNDADGDPSIAKST